LVEFRLDELWGGGIIAEVEANEVLDCVAGGSTHKRVQRYFDK